MESTTSMMKNYLNDDVRMLVTGGSGFIGTNVMDYLIEQNIDTINYDIKPPKKESHFRFWREVDLRNKGILEKEILAFKPTHILHLAAITGMEVTDESIFRVNTTGVVNIIECAEKCLTVKRIVFVSSLLVCKYGYIPKNDTDYCPPNLYGKSKVNGEKIIRKLENPSFTWCIVRPTSIWGPYNPVKWIRFIRYVESGLFIQPDIHIIKPISFVGNTIHMMLTILFHIDTKADKKTFYLADYPSTTTLEWSNIIRKTLNKSRTKTVPKLLMNIIAVSGDILTKFGYKSFPLTSFRLKNMLTGGEYPIENTRHYVGDLPYTINESVYITAQWMYENNLITHKPIKI